MTTAGAACFRPGFAWAEAALDPHTAKIVENTIGVDTHNHIDVPMTDAERPGPDIDLRGEIKKSGLSAICMTFATDYQKGDPYARFHHAMDAMDRQLKRNDIKRAFTADDIRTAHHEHQPVVIQAIEGAHFLEGKLERVQEAYQRGLRHFGLLHDSNAPTPLGDVYTNPARYGGMTPFGIGVVRECNRLGILIDLAHCDMKTTQDALRASTKPVVISHTGPDWRLGNDPHMAQMMRPRLIGKEQAKMVASAGGAVGVWLHLTDTPLEYAQNLRALADVIGVESVIIGTDTKLTTPMPHLWGPSPGGDHHDGPGLPPGSQPGFRPGQRHPQVGERTNMAWEGETAGFYYTVADAMLKTGFTVNEIAKIGGGNYLRIFGETVD